MPVPKCSYTLYFIDRNVAEGENYILYAIRSTSMPGRMANGVDHKSSTTAATQPKEDTHHAWAVLEGLIQTCGGESAQGCVVQQENGAITTVYTKELENYAKGLCIVLELTWHDLLQSASSSRTAMNKSLLTSPLFHLYSILGQRIITTFFDLITSNFHPQFLPTLVTKQKLAAGILSPMDNTLLVSSTEYHSAFEQLEKPTIDNVAANTLDTFIERWSFATSPYLAHPTIDKFLFLAPSLLLLPPELILQMHDDLFQTLKCLRSKIGHSYSANDIRSTMYVSVYFESSLCCFIHESSQLQKQNESPSSERVYMNDDLLQMLVSQSNLLFIMNAFAHASSMRIQAKFIYPKSGSSIPKPLADNDNCEEHAVYFMCISLEKWTIAIQIPIVPSATTSAGELLSWLVKYELFIQNTLSSALVSIFTKNLHKRFAVIAQPTLHLPSGKKHDLGREQLVPSRVHISFHNNVLLLYQATECNSENYAAISLSTLINSITDTHKYNLDESQAFYKPLKPNMIISEMSTEEVVEKVLVNSHVTLQTSNHFSVPVCIAVGIAHPIQEHSNSIQLPSEYTSKVRVRFFSWFNENIVIKASS